MSEQNSDVYEKAHMGKPLPPTPSEVELFYSSSFKTLTFSDSIFRNYAGEATGIPKPKRQFQFRQIFPVLISFLCLIIAAVVISPQLSLSWRLLYTGQIIVIGFLMSIQYICLRQIYPTVFLQAEARWGFSILQNYDAILQNSPLASYTSFIWRFSLFVLAVLPIGLSVGYKQFTGGSSTASIPSTQLTCGLTGPPGIFSPIGLSLAANLTIPYMEQLRNIHSNEKDISPYTGAYGFNMLLLSNGSTAFLDAPVPEDVNLIQNELLELETREITADVAAMVTRLDNSIAEGHRFGYYNLSSDQHTAKHELDDIIEKVYHSKWNQSFNIMSNLYQGHFYNGYSVYLLANNLVPEAAHYTGIAIMPSDSVYTNPILPGLYETFGDFAAAVEALTNFTNQASFFRTSREHCTGTWTITKTSIELKHGVCNGTELSRPYQELFSDQLLAIPDFFLPLTVEYCNQFTPPHSVGYRNRSDWFIPTAATTLGAITYSRILAIHGGTANHYHKGEFQYPVQSHIISTRPTLRANAGLFIIIALMPLMTAIFFVLRLWLWDTPIDDGFGLVSVLAGANRNSLHLLKGAGLSGKLNRAVQLRITTHARNDIQGNEAYIDYTLDGRGENESLLKGTIFY